MSSVKHPNLRYQIIDERIRNKFAGAPTLEELRSLCEERLYNTEGKHISKSTIEKDINTMREERDAPIYFDRAKGGYVYTDPNFSLHRISIEAEDANAIRMAIRTLRDFSTMPALAEFETAINKIFNRLYISEDLEDQELHRMVQFDTVAVVPGTRWLQDLYQQIKKQLVTEITYHAFSSDEIGTHLIHPYLLKEYRNRWYLVAFNPARNEIRTYELGRISEMKCGTDSFERDKGFHPDKYFAHSFGISVVHGEPQRVKLRFSAAQMRYLKNQPLHHTQRIINENEQFSDVEVEVYPEFEFYHALLGLGDGVKVLEPLSVKEKLIDIHKKAIKTNMD